MINIGYYVEMEKIKIRYFGFVVLKVKSYQGPAVLIVVVLVKIVESLKI